MPGRIPSFDSSGTFYGDRVTLASTTATAAGNGGPISTDLYDTLRLTLAVTAVAGTGPSITVTVETSHNGTTWTSLGSYAAATAVGTQRRVFTGLDRYVRASWTVAGTTPSVTFSVSGEAL